MRASAALFILSSLTLLLAGRGAPPKTRELQIDIDIIESTFQSCPESCNVSEEELTLCGCFALNSSSKDECTKEHISVGLDTLAPRSTEKKRMELLKRKLNHTMGLPDMSPEVELSGLRCPSLASPRHFLKQIRRLIEQLNQE